jgi:hypothetical protein
MRKQIAVAGAVALASLAAGPALAGAVSFVSVTGDDTRNCATPATACRTFQRAHDATSAHGEIIALTPGDYRPVTIAKSISVTGVEGAGIFGGASGSYQVTIAAGASDVVYLTGLTLDGAGSARRGVQVDIAGVVTLRKCAVRNVTNAGIQSNAGRLLLEDASVSRSQNDNIYLFFNGPSLVHRVVSEAAAASAIADFGDSLTISDASFMGSRDGIFQRSPVFMTRSAVTGNSQIGVDVFVGFTSAGDNFIRGNGTNVDGTVTNIGRQ